MRRKYRQRQQTDMGMDEGTDGKPVINLDRRRLDSFQLRELDSELVAVTRVFTLTGAEIPITCTKEERAVYEHRLSRRRSQQQLTHGQSVTTWDYLDCLNVLEERLCAAVSAFSSTEQCTTFFLKAFQSELLERENSGSEESDDDDDDDEEGEEGDDDDNDESTKAVISDKTAIGMDVNEVNVKDAYSAYNGHRTDNGSNMMVESPRSTVLSKTLTSIDSTARTVTSDAESVHIPAEPVRPILIAVRRASGYATQIVPVSEQLPTQVDPHMQTQIQTQTQSSVRMRFQVQLQCRQCPDNTYVYFINLRLDNQHLATSVNRGAVVKEFRIFAEKFELDVKRNNRR